ncbi:bifunctional lysylphosphatidylglycerol flippase/synthetase MprF [Amaricoccus solimangrovi]|uniref:Phosphatidylglycerol lysyltransferase n=1 Tax=Amaricoccus solimangrovi TaxID=2589815 RepID=A0A501WUY8_9RHOB|nr:bifunctional lysylphosphatidylglycerol flippase/synthetase MprF [Amaricoccus solimangrovi]TPE52125.1 bifunctional lysylphosphatidylglycerol flippase/synthetase MprF [Amaricoccus solimangrovi]
MRDQAAPRRDPPGREARAGGRRGDGRGGDSRATRSAGLGGAADLAGACPDEPSGGGPLDLLRKHAPVLITLCLFAAGLYALHRLLAPLDFRDVLRSIRATPTHIYLSAIGATAIGYAALVGYDWTGARYIGKHLPLPSVALGGFLGYAFGNTIGLSALSGGAVRYRIYTSLGLDGYDVAAISGYVAIAYGLGATVIGLGALALHPTAIAGISALPPGTVRLLSVAAFVAMVGIILVLTLRQASLRLRWFEIRAPRLSDVSWQILFCSVDIAAASFALYVLLPTGDIGFVTFIAVYAVAVMIGVASHVPGGVGVFESVIIAALGASVPVADAVTGLLLFRIIYYILPFVLALVLLSLSEIWTATGKSQTLARLQPVLQAGQSVIPLAMGMVVLAAGLFMMFSGLLRGPMLRNDAVEDAVQHVMPLLLLEGGALLTSVLGSALVVLALGMFRRSRAAFWLALCAMGLGIGASLLHGADYDRALILALLALLILPCRREFYRDARLTQGVLSPQWILFTLAILLSIGVTYYAVHRSAPYTGAMWWQFSVQESGPRALRAALTGSVALMLALLFAAMKTRAWPSQASNPDSLERARAIIEAHGRAPEMLAVTGDKMLMFSETGDAVVSYGVRGGSWIALGAPVGAAETRGSLAWAFHDAARAAGARPIFFGAPERFIRQSVELGLALHRMGDEAVVPLTGFSLEGPARRELRRIARRGRRAGLSVEILRPPHAPGLWPALRRVSDAWLAQRGGRERRFAFGFFDPAYLRGFPIAVARQRGEIVAFASLFVTRSRDGAAVDLMRHHPDAPRDAMAFLLSETMRRLSLEGYREFSLGPAPLASARGGGREADVWIRFAALIHRRGERDYDVGGVRRFRQKFAPDWRPIYLCARSVLAPTAPLADAAALIAGSPPAGKRDPGSRGGA